MDPDLRVLVVGRWECILQVARVKKVKTVNPKAVARG